MNEWKPIAEAPEGVSLLLYCSEHIPLYCGRQRYGRPWEPQQGVFAWRCDSSGHFADPSDWAFLPAKPNRSNK